MSAAKKAEYIWTIVRRTGKVRVTTSERIAKAAIAQLGGKVVAINCTGVTPISRPRRAKAGGWSGIPAVKVLHGSAAQRKPRRAKGGRSK